MIHFDVVTIFPRMVLAGLAEGVVSRGIARGLIDVAVHDLRDHTVDRHRTVDDVPYGGGPGMVMMAQPLSKAMAAARQRQLSCGVRRTRTIYLSPQGRPLTQKIVEEMGQLEGLVLLAGRYEGVDERLLEAEVQDQISIGDYVLSGGELPAMVLMDALIRRIPGVLNDAESAQRDSFEEGLLDFPHYTRPELYQGEPVPAVLLSGHHVDIARWRMKQSLGRTWERRPELLARVKLSADQAALLEEYKAERNETQELIK